MGSGNGFGFVGRKRRVVDGTGAARAPCGYQSGRARGGPGAARTRTHSQAQHRLLSLPASPLPLRQTVGTRDSQLLLYSAFQV